MDKAAHRFGTPRKRSRCVGFSMVLLAAGLSSACSRVDGISEQTNGLEKVVLADERTTGNATTDTSDKRATGGKGITVLGSAPTVVDEATLFSFDDVCIPFTDNLFLKMTPPKKHAANPVVPLGGKGEPDEWSVQFYGSVIRHEGKFKMWYIAADEDAFQKFSQKRGFYGARPAYAESNDGIHWVKPDLGLVEYRGNRNNNLVLMQPPAAMGLALVVLHDRNDPDPSRRFKMMLHMRCYINGKKAGHPAPFYSRDGLRWRLAVKAELDDYSLPAEGMVLPPQHFELSGLYRWKGMYYLLGQQLDPWVWLPDGERCGRVLTIFRSPDFVHWSNTKTLAFVRDGYRHRSVPAGPGRGEESHQASVWHRGNVLLATYGLWHGGPKWKDRTIDLGLLISNDGLHFREPIPDFVFIPRGEDGRWDQGGLLQAQAFENVAEETFLWYGHWDPRVGTDYKPRGGVGLVTLKRDRFGFLATKDPSGAAAFMTCLLRVGGTAQLSINADGLSENARLRVELLDELERPLSRYSGDGAAVVKQSGLRAPVSWNGLNRIENLRSPFKIRVSLEGTNRQDVKIYALYVSERADRQ